MNTRPMYALYYTTKFGPGVPAVRVRIMGEADKAGRVPVRVTSNRHPVKSHGQAMRVSGSSLSLYYRADGSTVGGNFQ